MGGYSFVPALYLVKMHQTFNHPNSKAIKTAYKCSLNHQNLFDITFLTKKLHNCDHAYWRKLFKKHTCVHLKQPTFNHWELSTQMANGESLLTMLRLIMKIWPNLLVLKNVLQLDQLVLSYQSATKQSACKNHLTIDFWCLIRMIITCHLP